MNKGNVTYEVPESIVLVKNKDGAVATLRYSNRKKDIILSGSHKSIYYSIENYVMTGRSR